MAGKVAVVTGATGGIGREVARALARLGAHLVIAARDPNRGDATAVQITREGAAGDISAMLLDAADIESVRDFAMAFDRRFDRLDVLVNNAGAWFSDRRESPDGCELTFATNVLGPYLLTQLLADPLISSPNGRIVNVVSSIGGHYDASDLQFERRRFDGYKAYAQSKQALCMLT